jgi:hypothetical protein
MRVRFVTVALLVSAGGFGLAGWHFYLDKGKWAVRAQF